MTATLTSPVDFGTVTLTELSQATKNYLDNEVEVRIGDVTRNLNEHGEGTFSVRVTNSTVERGVRLTDVTIHLEAGNGAVVTLDPQGPAYLEFRTGGSRTDPEVPANTRVDQLYVFFPNPPGVGSLDDILDPGESVEISMGYYGEGVGQTNLKAHVHASVAFEDLFPRTRSGDVKKPVTIG